MRLMYWVFFDKIWRSWSRGCENLKLYLLISTHLTYITLDFYSSLSFQKHSWRWLLEIHTAKKGKMLFGVNWSFYKIKTLEVYVFFLSEWPEIQNNTMVYDVWARKIEVLLSQFQQNCKNDYTVFSRPCSFIVPCQRAKLNENSKLCIYALL